MSDRTTKFAEEIHARIMARKLVDALCEDPEVWLTHGMPPEEKLEILEVRIAEALVEFCNARKQ